MSAVEGVYELFEKIGLKGEPCEEIKPALADLKIVLESARAQVVAYQQERSMQRKTALRHRGFDSTLAEFQLQIEDLRLRLDSNTADAIEVATQLHTHLSSLGLQFIEGEIDVDAFKKQCMKEIQNPDVKLVLGAPRGDWSFTRILGELVRLLAHFFGHTMAAPRFFKTTTETKLDTIEQSVSLITEQDGTFNPAT